MDKGILDLENKIGLKQGFLQRLSEEDDWSFIIKLHALFEAVCTHLLLYHFKEPRLKDVLSRLELSNQSTGKIAFLEATELIGEFERKYIRKLSELRNKLVHDVKNTNFSLKGLVESFNDKELTAFVKTFSPHEVFTIEINKQHHYKHIPKNYDINMLKKRALNNPKDYMIVGAHNVLVDIVDAHSFSDYKQWIKAKEIFDEEV